IRVELVKPLDRGHPLLNEPCLVLRKVADGYFMTPADRSRINVFGGCRKVRRIRKQGFEERGLADAVSSDKDDFLAAIHDGVEVGDDLVVTELLRDTRTFHREASRWTRLREL